MSGSVYQDKNLGGHITDFKITIDGNFYQGAFNAQNPVFSIGNGDVNYTKTQSGSGDYTYSVKHEAGASIRVELKDDDGLWSEVETMFVPEYLQ